MSQTELLRAINDAIKAIDGVFRTQYGRLPSEVAGRLVEARYALLKFSEIRPTLAAAFEDFLRRQNIFLANLSTDDYDASLASFTARLREADAVLGRLSQKSIEAYIENWSRKLGTPLESGNLASELRDAILGIVARPR